VGFGFKATVTGLANAAAKLEDLKRGMRNRILRKALRAGARPLTQLAKAFVRQRTRTYEKAIGVVLVTDKRTGTVKAVIRARGGKTTENEDPVRISHLEEEGRQAVEVSQGKKVLSAGPEGPTFGRRARAAEGSHAFRRAYDQGRGLAVAEVERVIAEELRRVS
jgi:hypothetical protein